MPRPAHDRFGAALAVLLSGVLVFAGVAPAGAATASDPQQSSAAAEAAPTSAEEAVPEEDAPGGDSSPAPTAPAPEAPAPAPEEPAPAPEEPAPEPADPAPSVPTPVETAPAAPEAEEDPGIITPFAAVADCVGGNTVCGTLILTSVVQGGTATVGDWVLRASDVNSDDWYDFASGQQRRVDKPGSYLLEAIGTPGVTDDYVTTLDCFLNDTSGGTRLQFTEPNALQYIGTGSGSLVASCTFTHTFTGPGTLTLTKGGERTGAQSVGPLAGATFAVYRGGTATTPDTSPANLVGTCVTGDAGTCDVEVPSGEQYWVIETAAPDGYRVIESFDLGSGTGVTATPYRLRTAVVAAGQTTVYPQPTTGNTNLQARGSQWANAAENPALAQGCGLRVGLLVDLSNSLLSSQQDLRNAAAGFVDALEGTPSSIGIWTFAGSAPAVGAANTTLPLTPVSTAAGASTVRTKAQGLTVVNTNTWAQGTNWDQGLWQVTQESAADTLDVVLVLTDGSPTYYGPPGAGTGGAPAGPGSTTRVREMENAVFSANALKLDRGTTVVGVGIGPASAGEEQNLQAISGPSQGTDYFLVEDYAALQEFLEERALGECAGTVNVTKLVIPADGELEDAAPTAGWTFGATTTTPGVTIDPATAETNQTGAVSFAASGLASAGSAAVTVTETQQPGYQLVQQDGLNAACQDNTGTAVTVTNSGASGFTTSALEGAIVTCTVYNRAPDPTVSLRVDKAWVVNGQSYADGEQPVGTADLLLDEAAATFGTVYPGYTVGETVAIGETVTDLPSGCTYTSTGAGPYEIQAENPNVVTVTNTVTCVTTLTLAKTVANGDAAVTDFTLSSAPIGGTGLPGPSGTSGATADVTPGVRYVLSETGPGTYLQTVEEGVTLVEGATGSWDCLLEGTDIDGADGAVTVNLGQEVTCTAVNQTATMVLLKQVVNDEGGTLTADEWDLTADPGENEFGLQPTTVTGGPNATTANTFAVRPGQEYTLTETDSPTGYRQFALEQLVGATWVQVDPTVTVPALGQNTYRFVNVDVAPRLTLVKEVTNDDGGTAAASEWQLSATSPGEPGISGATGTPETTSVALTGGVPYTLAESEVPGYTWASLTCDNGAQVSPAAPTLTLAVGEDVTCTFVNDDVAPRLTLLKTVTNAQGGTAVPTDWTLSAVTDGGPNLEGVSGSDDVTDVEVAAGATYTLAEADGPSGYEWVLLSCDNGAEISPDSPTLVLEPGDDVTCTFGNTDLAGSLTLVKELVNDDGGAAVPSDWDQRLSVQPATGDPILFDHNATIEVPGGTYTLSETEQVAGYEWTDLSCTIEGTTLDSPTVTVPNGANVTCTFVNDDIAPTLTLVKTVVNDDGGTAAATDWTLTAGTTEGDEISGATGSTEVTGAPVLANTEYTLSETGGPDGYDWSSLACDGGATTSVDDPTLTLALAEAVTCTFVNDDVPGSLTLLKEVVSDDGGTAAPEDWNGALTAQPAGGTAIAFDHATTQPVPAGDYALAEVGGPGGYEHTDLACSPGGTSLDAPTVTVANGADVLCTFTNDDIPPTLTLLKTVTNDDGGTAVPTDWTLSATSPTGPDLSGVSGSADVTGIAVLAGAEYTLGETGGPGGYEWTSLACDNGATITPQAPTVTFAVGEDVTCTFVNDDLPGSLTLEKVVDNALGGSAVPTDWNQRLVAQPASGAPITFDHAQTQQVSAGTYTLSEVDQLADYEATALSCSTGGVTLESPTVTVANGASVTCTFTNASVGPTLTLVKEVDNRGGIGTATADAWTLNAVAGADDPALSGTGTPAGGTSASLSGQVAADADYTLSETFGPSGYTAGEWACTETASGAEVPLAVAGVVRLTLGTDVTCTITNTAIPAEGTIDKQVGAGSPTQNADGSWTITYDIVVTNNSDTSTYIYSLADELRYGDGITPTAASWTGPGGTSGDFTLPAGTAVLATDATLPSSGDPTARATATYTVTVTATVANGTQEGDTWRCSTAPGTPENGGFLNAATLSSTDADDQTAYGCGEPVFPTLVKTGTDPATQNPDASWNLAYTLTVSNPGASAVAAALTDTLPEIPDGWVLVGGTWAVAATGDAPAPTTTSGAPGATVPIWTGSLDPGGSVAYEVTGVLRPTAEGVDPGPCDTSGGVINTAGVTSGEIVLEAEGCVSVRIAGVTVAKGDGVAQQLPDGNWQIDYTVTVANTSADVATVYTLTDQPDLGEGIGLISGEWVGTAPVPDATLAAGATAEFVFRILASVDIADDPSLTCEPGEGGGFFNTVNVAYPGGEAGDDACAEPAVPSVAKVAQEPQALGGGVWAVAYDVTVSNTSGITVAYSVEDRPQPLPDGVALVTAWTAEGPVIQPGGAGTATPTAGWDGDGQPEVATGVIPDGATHTYTVRAQISVAAADPAVLVCGESPTERTGVWNTARVDNRVGEQTAEECSELIVEPVTLEKSDGTVTSLGDGRWRIDYTVTVTNPGPLPTTYTLTDAPQFDTAFAIAAQGWVGSPNVADVEIEPGGIDTYTYRVDAVAVQDPLPLTALACTDAGGGFFNTATATHPGGVATDSGCAVPWAVPPGPPPVEPGVAWTGGLLPVGALWLGSAALGAGILALLTARRRHQRR